MKNVWKSIWQLVRVGVCIEGYHGKTIAIYMSCDEDTGERICDPDKAFQLLKYAKRMKYNR